MKLSEQILRKPLFIAFGQALAGGGITSVDLAATRSATNVTLTASDGSAAPIAAADASNAGVMTAADRAKLDGLSDVATRDFPARSDAATAAIGAEVSHFRTAGYSTAGDGGGALYSRVGAEPSHNLKVQSADTAWWALVPDSHGYINVRQAGAVGDDVANDGQAFIDALSFASYNATTFNHATNGVIVPPGAYYLGATTLELKATVHLLGQDGGHGVAKTAKLRWDANVTGIVVHRYNTIGTTTEADPLLLGADGSKIEGLWLHSDGGTIAGITDELKGHGIWLRARAILADNLITNFPGNGYHIAATAGGGGNAEGNANNWVIERATIAGCHQNGIFVDGADVNAGYCIGADCSKNGRWGIFDSSFLGNVYMACHTAANGVASYGENGADGSSFVHFDGNLYAANVGASEAQLVATEPGTDETVWYLIGAGTPHATRPTWQAAQPEGTYFHGGPYRSDNANARNVFTGNYSEGGQGPSQFVRPTTVFGGFVGGVRGTAVVHTDDDVLGTISYPNHRTSNFEPARDLTLAINTQKDGILKFYAAGAHSGGVGLCTWDEATGQMLIGEYANSTGLAPIRIATTLNTTTHGRASAQTGGNLFLHRGVWIGPGAGTAKYFGGFFIKPASGEAGRGDKWWNYNPLIPGDPAGWRCTTSGTIGAGAVMEEYFYLPDLPGGHPGYTVRPKSDGTNRVQWREAAKAGAVSIADTASTVAVTFATAMSSANYAVAVAPDGDERVWVTAKATTGFTLNRLATSGARAVDWTATPHEDL